MSVSRHTHHLAQHPGPAVPRRYPIRAVGAGLAAPLMIALACILAALPIQQPQAAHSNTSAAYVIDTAAEFRQACTQLSNASITDAGGGELRLAATLEDYFDDGAIDATRWISGYARTWYNSPPPYEADGMLHLFGTYLRSTAGFTQTRRFFETRARLRVAGQPTGWPDLGFIREGELQGEAMEPGFPRTAGTASRLFLANDSNGLLAWGRDGEESNPLQVIYFPAIDLEQMHVFRIEWEPGGARFFIDGVQQPGTMNGDSSLRSWAWLFSMIASRPIHVDWVRAGEHAPAGEAVCQIDAGQSRVWQTFALNLAQPAGTTVVPLTRTSEDGMTWTAWAPVVNETVADPVGRYLQFQLTLTSSDPFASPEVQRVVVTNALPPTPTETPTPTTTIEPPRRWPVYLPIVPNGEWR